MTSCFALIRAMVVIQAIIWLFILVKIYGVAGGVTPVAEPPLQWLCVMGLLIVAMLAAVR